LNSIVLIVIIILLACYTLYKISPSLFQTIIQNVVVCMIISAFIIFALFSLWYHEENEKWPWSGEGKA
jgi:hypothetical protein